MQRDLLCVCNAFVTINYLVCWDVVSVEDSAQCIVDSCCLPVHNFLNFKVCSLDLIPTLIPHNEDHVLLRGSISGFVHADAYVGTLLYRSHSFLDNNLFKKNIINNENLRRPYYYMFVLCFDGWPASYTRMAELVHIQAEI